MTAATMTAAVPRFASPVPDGTDIEAARVGAELQRLPLTPQGELVAGVLEARAEGSAERPLYRTATIQIPRRSTKTTTIQNVLLGRCATRPGYQVVSTAQDGTRASQFMRDLMDLIEAHALEVMDAMNETRWEGWEEGMPEPPEVTRKDALAQLGIAQMYYSQQREYIKWRNGSRWRVAKPDPSGLRGGAADVIWFDEAGELNPEDSPTLLAGALPMMDTRPNGQVIISGTPGLVRAGMFWDRLELARADPGRLGIVDYSADDWADVEDEAVWWAVHAGLACGLTSIETLRERFAELGPVQFAREYLCIWPPDSTSTALDLKKWEATKGPALGEPPAGVPWAIGWDVDPTGAEAAVAVAWVDNDDVPHVQILDHRAGSQWVSEYVAKGLMKHTRAMAAYDSIGQNISVAQAIARVPRVQATRVKALALRDVAGATATLAQALELMSLVHAEHGGLDAAVAAATWRESAGSRLFMRGKGKSIACLLACVHALALASTMPRTVSRRLPAPALG